MIWTTEMVLEAARRMASDMVELGLPWGATIYPVPGGGVPVAYLITGTTVARNQAWSITEFPGKANCFVDDLVDSGRTRGRYAVRYPDVPFLALHTKVVGDDWHVFPWEQGDPLRGAAKDGGEDTVVRLLEYIGEDPKRGGLLETPARVLKAWRFWTSGYGKDPVDVLKCFEDGADGVDEMVVVRNIPFYSQCEHHLAPFFGTATIAYIPQQKIVGLSKLSRLLDIFARRLQVQERLTNQVADALFDNLNPLGVGVLIRAKHLCMESRGVCQQGHETVTSALRGVMHDESSARSEFLTLAMSKE